MSKLIKVNYRDTITMEFPKETTLLEVSSHFKDQYQFDILAAQIDNEIVTLDELLVKNCNIDFYDRSYIIGNSIYEKSLHFIVVAAVRRIYGIDSDVVIEHSMDKGFYCEIPNQKITEKKVEEIKKVMDKIVKEDLRFEKVNVSRFDAINYFKKKKQFDKVNLLKYISNSYINLYCMDNMYDYFFSDLAYSTKSIDNYELTYIENTGFVVSYPDIYFPKETENYTHHALVFDAFMKYTNWGRFLGVTNASDFNKIVSNGTYKNFILMAETYYEEQLAIIADKIHANKKNIKLVLLAGPSSSGKTTTAKRLEVYLNSRGLKTYQISIDDYFVNRSDTPKDKNGKFDFESINAVDLNLFNNHMMQLLDGHKVTIPEYNFILGKREYKNKEIELKENDIVIIEGLHALNDQLTMSIDTKNKYRIYISPLTHLNIDNHNRIHTSDLRRLRRIVRDNKYRGRSASETLKMWESIKEGEDNYIFPFQDDADVIINSALIYEIGVLKVYAEPLLFTVEESDPMYYEAIRLINFLRNFLSIPSEVVPNDSVLREFIGGSSFNE
jgi:uridine kinase